TDEYDARFPIYALDGRRIKLAERPLYRALRQKERSREMIRSRRADGSEVVLEVVSAPLPGPADGAVSAYRDVTAQLRVAADRRERAAQLKALLDPLPVGVAYFDTDGVCRACNGPARTILARSRGEIIGATAVELFAGVDGLRDGLLRCLGARAPHAEGGVP